MSRDACLSALEGYRRSVRRIAESLASRDPQLLAGGARLLLDDLEFRVQVDLDARATVAGGERMSEIEAALFAPTLKQVQSEITTRIVAAESAQWLPVLLALEATLSDATRQARHWVPNAG